MCIRLAESKRNVSEFGITLALRIIWASVKDAAEKSPEKLRDLLRQIRTDAGFTQAELAERIGVPQSFVSKYESGERRLDILELKEVCQALGSSLLDFVRRLEKEIP